MEFENLIGEQESNEDKIASLDRQILSSGGATSKLDGVLPSIKEEEESHEDHEDRFENQPSGLVT